MELPIIQSSTSGALGPDTGWAEELFSWGGLSSLTHFSPQLFKKSLRAEMLVLSVPQWTNKFRKRPQAKKKKMLTEMKERKQSTSMVRLDPCNSHVAEPRQKTKLLFFFFSLSVFFLMSVNSVRKQSSILFGASCGSFCLFSPMAFSYLAVCASFPKCLLPHSRQALADALTYISLVIGFKSGLNAPPPPATHTPKVGCAPSCLWLSKSLLQGSFTSFEKTK